LDYGKNGIRWLIIVLRHVLEPKEKFIGFVDILGFKDLVERAEVGDGVTFSQINDAVSALGSEKDIEAIRLYGPSICPESKRQHDDLDFEITQVSDCMIVSSEISPAGAITIIDYCWRSVFRLLRCGFMCRGNVRRGNIFHRGYRFMGSGYQRATEREKEVEVFKRFEDDRGTPFVEVDSSIVDYINSSGDRCLKMTLPRFLVKAKSFYALFPFNRLTDYFDIGPDFNAAAKKKEINLIRSSIKMLELNLHRYVAKDNPRAKMKLEHYLIQLEGQLKKCNQLEETVDFLDSPYPYQQK
jgi:hypothetical protein